MAATLFLFWGDAVLFHTVQHEILTESLRRLRIVPISDTHIGDKNFDDKLLMQQINDIKDSNDTLVMLVGDLVNNGIKSSVTNVYEEVLKPGEQIKYLVKLLDPIKDKIIGAVEGNHERRTSREVDQSPTERYCERLGIRFFADEVLLRIPFGKCSAEGNTIHYTAYFTHGYGGGRLPGGKVNMLSRMGDIVVADAYCTAHTHMMHAHPEIIYVPDVREQKVREVEMMYVSTGSYLKRGGYAAQKGYAPVKLGSPVIELDGKRKSVKATI